MKQSGREDCGRSRRRICGGCGLRIETRNNFLHAHLKIQRPASDQWPFIPKAVEPVHVHARTMYVHTCSIVCYVHVHYIYISMHCLQCSPVTGCALCWLCWLCTVLVVWLVWPVASVQCVWCTACAKGWVGGHSGRDGLTGNGTWQGLRALAAFALPYSLSLSSFLPLSLPHFRQ